jgi:hypothetical protein
MSNKLAGRRVQLRPEADAKLLCKLLLVAQNIRNDDYFFDSRDNGYTSC